MVSRLFIKDALRSWSDEALLLWLPEFATLMFSASFFLSIYSNIACAALSYIFEAQKVSSSNKVKLLTPFTNLWFYGLIDCSLPIFPAILFISYYLSSIFCWVLAWLPILECSVPSARFIFLYWSCFWCDCLVSYAILKIRPDCVRYFRYWLGRYRSRVIYSDTLLVRLHFVGRLFYR